jgi:hypothetical protein
MLGSFVSRFRVVTLLLAFALGLAAQAMSNVAMAAHMQSAADAGISPDVACPGCDTDMQHGGLAPSCRASSCWTVPALPPQSATLERQPAAGFPPSADAIVTGITSAPDPHPPRDFLHS